MKRDLKEFFRLIQSPLLIALGVLPIPMMVFTYLQPELQKYAWIFPVSYFALTFISFFLPGKLRFPFGLLGAVGLIAPWCFIVPGESMPLCLCVAVAFSLLLLWSIRIGGWNSEKELHSAWIGTCLCFQLLGQAVLFVDLQTIQQPMKVLAPWLYISFLGTIILCLLSMNRKGINAITSENSAVTRAMRRKNVVLVVALVAIAALFSLLPSAWGIIKTVIKWFTDFIKLFEWELPDETLPSITRPPETETGDMPQIEVNVGVHTDILNILFQVFFALLVIIGLPLALRLYWKRIAGAIKNLWNSLLISVSDSMTDYEDEITDTRDSVIADEAQATGIKRGKRIFSDRGLSNKDKIRYRYRQLQKKNPQWHKGTTARENLPESPASIYEKARYSNHPISAEDADRFKSETKKV